MKRPTHLVRYVNVLFCACLLALSGMPFLASSKVESLSGSQWKADRIIDDAIFYAGAGMSTEAIQDFLNAKMPSCDINGTQNHTYRYNSSTGRVNFSGNDSEPADPWVTTTRAVYGSRYDNYFHINDARAPYTCLKSFSQAVPSRAADGFCAGSIGSGTKTAAQIIADVARACNINPKVILITLQKEQSLLTDDWPWKRQYTKATGFGCPDSDLSADVDANQNGCYDQYEGFFNQIYYGARQFQKYKINADEYNHRAQQTSRIYYHPTSSCGYTDVKIYNHATAGLYNYTPYQPNQAALDDLYGSGDIANPAPPNCSSFGNRNFWRMFNDWFGNPQFDPEQDIPLVGDWDGDGKDSNGIRRGNMYYLDNDNDGDSDWEFGFGDLTDQHLVGDWDGDGSDEIGLKRGDRYYFSTDFNGTSEIYQAFGNPTDQAVVGDWDGDGRDEIGLKRGERYYLNYNYDGTAERYIGFGNASDKVLVGDWDGDGKDNLALRRDVIYFFDYNYDGQSEVVFGYGSSFHQTIVGDWDDDGKDEIGLKNGEFYNLDTDMDSQTEIFTGLGVRSDKTIIGDWNGDGKDTLGVKRGSYYYLDNTSDGHAEVVYYYTF